MYVRNATFDNRPYICKNLRNYLDKGEKIVPTSTNFYRSDEIATAYVAKRAKDFNLLVAGQVEEIYLAKGMIFPVNLSSTLEFISRDASVSQSMVARALDQPHQLIAYRIKELEKLDLVERKPDPDDGRKTLLYLTKKGRLQAKLLKEFTEIAATIFDQLFDEIGFNLSSILGSAIRSLKSHPLEMRFKRISALQQAC